MPRVVDLAERPLCLSCEDANVAHPNRVTLGVALVGLIKRDAEATPREPT